MATFIVNPKLTRSELKALREKQYQKFLILQNKLLNHPVIMTIVELRALTTDAANEVGSIMKLSQRIEQMALYPDIPIKEDSNADTDESSSR